MPPTAATLNRCILSSISILPIFATFCQSRDWTRKDHMFDRFRNVIFRDEPGFTLNRKTRKVFF